KKISTGTYNRISIYDNYKEEFINMELVDSMTMTEEKKGPPLAMIISLGVVFFSLLLVFIMRKKKETKKEKSDIPTIEKELEEEKELEKELGTEAEKETSVVASKKRLTVKGKRKMGGELSLEDFKEQIKKKDLIGPLDQEELWVDTVLKEIYFSPKFIADLQDFLEKESLEVMVEETGGMTPEIGGFLMGKYTKDKEDYHLSIEELIPFNPEYSDAFKIEIGTKTQVQELGTALEEHPDMAVVGWFHTHPGHGLFLSNPDQIVHQHFPHPFQVAMEIESLTDELDLAFFSRKKDGEMNNTYTSGKPKEWFSWKEVEQQSKT
ncbi:MAG: hypothetical protein ACPG5P_08265, partial [Saprospiraceae bacterium]